MKRICLLCSLVALCAFATLCSATNAKEPVASNDVPKGKVSLRDASLKKAESAKKYAADADAMKTEKAELMDEVQKAQDKVAKLKNSNSIKWWNPNGEKLETSDDSSEGKGQSEDPGDEKGTASSDDSKLPLPLPLPLPGKPIDVRPANINAFAQIKALLFDKTGYVPSNAAIGIGPLTKKIDSHNFFVLEIGDVETFQKDVQAWIAQKFDNKAAALITEDYVRVLQ